MWTVLNVVWLIAVVVALVTLTAGLCAAYFFLRSALKESRLRYAKEIVDRAVLASEQLAISKAMPSMGAEKKNVVLHLVSEVEDLNIDPDLLDFMIEAAVFENFFHSLKDEEEAETLERHIQG